MGEYFYRENLPKKDTSVTPDSYFIKSINKKEVKEDILLASHNLADYLHAEKIPNVMFLDGSARQTYLGLKEAWKQDYVEEKSPTIYFINPQQLYSEDDFPYLAEEFEKKYKQIDPEETILLYDVCLHTGRTTNIIKEFFVYLGFKDVRLAVTSVGDYVPEDSKKSIDFICLPKKAKLGCHPFGNPAYVDDNGSLVSSINYKKRDIGAAEHQKIKDVFK